MKRYRSSVFHSIDFITKSLASHTLVILMKLLDSRNRRTSNYKVTFFLSFNSPFQSQSMAEKFVSIELN